MRRVMNVNSGSELTSSTKFWYLMVALEVMFWPEAASTTVR